MNYASLKKLHSLFFETKLIALSKNIPRTPKKQQVNNNNNNMSPTSEKILAAMTPRSREILKNEMLEDDVQIENLERNEEMLDPDYQEKMENNGLGFFMENFVSINGVCPVCGQKTLHKYSHSNIPVVDFVCTNWKYHLETQTCFLYQLKISLTSEYFNLNKQSISVGSVVYGVPSHLVNGNEPINRKYYVPGYICIKLYPVPDQIQKYQIDFRNSFVLVPNFHSTINETYYSYRDTKNIYGKSIITWNNKMIDVFSLQNVLSPMSIEHAIYNEEEIENPYKNLI